MRFLLMTGCAGLLLCATGCAPKDTSEADAQTIKTRSDDWSKAAAAKDVAKFASFYSDDATMMFPAEPAIHGMKDIKSVVGATMQDPNFAMSFTTDKVDVSGTLAYSQGAVSMTSTMRNGKPFTDKGKYLTAWKKQADGSWLVVEDIFNSDAPPPDEKDAK
jgi:ketosteroid isomerase-like protein